LIGDLLVGGARVPIEILAKDRRQLFHLVTLRIHLPDCLDVRNRMVEIKQLQIEDEFAFHHAYPGQVLIFLRFAFRAFALAGRRP
jgi:hypothetical protein